MFAECPVIVETDVIICIALDIRTCAGSQTTLCSIILIYRISFLVKTSVPELLEALSPVTVQVACILETEISLDCKTFCNEIQIIFSRNGSVHHI